MVLFSPWRLMAASTIDVESAIQSPVENRLSVTFFIRGTTPTPPRLRRSFWHRTIAELRYRRMYSSLLIR